MSYHEPSGYSRYPQQAGYPVQGVGEPGHRQPDHRSGAYSQGYRQPPGGQQHDAAPLWRRLVARLVDVAVAVPLSFAFCVPVAIVFLPIYLPLKRDGAAYDATLTVGAWTCIFLAFVAIEWLLLVRRDGQTLGKGLMGLRVVRDDKRAEVLPWGSAFVRMLVLLGLNYSPALLVAWPVNLVVVLCNRRRKALHDFAAGTRVVRASKRAVNLKADFMMAMPVPTRVSLDKRV
jgi:uncharacterized RDD family membrane protein YckC